MRMPKSALGAIVALGLLAQAPAHAVPKPGAASLRGWLGFTTLSLNDINSQIEAQQIAIAGDTLVDESDWNPFGGAPNLGLELDVQLTPMVSAGLGASYHKSSVSHEVYRVFSLDEFGEVAEFEAYDERVEISAWDVVGNVALWIPSAPGLHFGGQLGLVRGTYSLHGVYQIDTFTQLPDLRFTEGTFRGTGVVLGAFTGYEQRLASQLTLMTRIGYRYREIDRPLGTTYTTNWGDQGNEREWEDGPLLDQNGQPMSLDLGGFYFQIGLSATLGGD